MIGHTALNKWLLQSSLPRTPKRIGAPAYMQCTHEETPRLRSCPPIAPLFRPLTVLPLTHKSSTLFHRRKPTNAIRQGKKMENIATIAARKTCCMRWDSIV